MSDNYLSNKNDSSESESKTESESDTKSNSNMKDDPDETASSSVSDELEYDDEPDEDDDPADKDYVPYEDDEIEDFEVEIEEDYDDEDDDDEDEEDDEEECDDDEEGYGEEMAEDNYENIYNKFVYDPNEEYKLHVDDKDQKIDADANDNADANANANADAKVEKDKSASSSKISKSRTHTRFDKNGQQSYILIMTAPPHGTVYAPHDQCPYHKDRKNDEEDDGEEDRKSDKDQQTRRPAKRTRTEMSAFAAKLNEEEYTYWKRMSPPEKESLLDKYKDMIDNNNMKDMPLRFKLLQADLDASSKSLILSKLDQFQKMPEHSGEYFKLRNWLQSIARIPLGIYKPLPIKKTDAGNHKDAVNFLKDVKKTLDSKVYGHEDSKDQLMRILAQWLSNPESKGNCIGIQGSMGVGKTNLVKEGLCKALGLPFGFISLGGATDSSFLDGHSFTYEGSTYGKIVEILMKTQCMNPIIFFDELDKVSHTYRGEEIIGILTHITDSSQNERFNDRYFGEIDLNLSKALFVFSYNDESKINPILKDRMITIRVPGYGVSDKLCIARDYLIPELLKEYKKTKEDIIFSDEIIESIIQKVAKEEGVRNLKRGIECIISWLNMHTYIPIVNSSNSTIQSSDVIPNENQILYTYPVTVTEEHVNKYIKEDIYDIKNSPAYHMYL